MKMKRFVFLSQAALASSLCASPPQVAPQAPRTEFTSHVYFVIQGETPFQRQRGERLIRQQFQENFETIPTLADKHYQVRAEGNEIAFSLVTPNDVRNDFQAAVTRTVGGVNGMVRTKGRYDFLRTDFEPTPRSSLLVVLDADNAHIRTIVARSVPLRDLLGELQMQLSEAPPMPIKAAPRARRPRSNFSYSLPTNCAQREVDWNFGAPEAPQAVPANDVLDVPSQVKSIDDAMQEIARVFHINVENRNGNYRFDDCPPVAVPRRQSALEFLPTRWIAEPAPQPAPTPVPVGLFQ